MDMINTIERLEIGEEYRPSATWIRIVCPRHYILGTLQVSKMLQCSNTELCIFAPGFCAYLDFDTLEIKESKHKLPYRTEVFSSPAVMVSPKTLLTIDEKAL